MVFNSGKTKDVLPASSSLESRCMDVLSLSAKAITIKNLELTSIKKPVAARPANIPELKDSWLTMK